MRNKRTWIAAAAALIALAVGLVMTLREPSYGGKTLTEWLEQSRESYRYHSDNPAVVERLHAEARVALLQMGSRAHRSLVEMLLERATPVTRTRRWLGEKLDRHFSTPAERFELALEGFSLLGTNGQDAVPALVKRFADEPAYVCRALELLGPGAESATPVLLHGLETLDAQTRRVILRVVPKIQPNPVVVVGVLLPLLNDPDRYVRILALQELRMLGAKAGIAVPDLQHQLTVENDSEINRLIQRTLREINFATLREQPPVPVRE